MPKIIVTSRFIRVGNHSKLNNYVKYIATREGVELTEQKDLQKNINREIFINYLGTRPNVVKQGTHGLFSDTDDQIILDKAAKEVAQHDGTVWTHIVSLRRDDAERMGYNTLDMWRDLVRRHIGDIAEAQKISAQNVRWYAAFHNKESNPHVHIVMYSVDPKEGYLTNAGIEKIRSAFANDIYRNELQNLYEQQTEVRNNIRNDAEQLMNSLVKDLQNTDEVNQTLQDLVIKLSTQLQHTKGKKVYGYLQPEAKKTVDKIVGELAKTPALQKMYALWCELEQQKYSTYTSAVPSFPPLEENKVFKSIKNSVIRAVLDMDISPELETPIPSIAPDEVEETSDEPQENITAESYHMNWQGDYKIACGLMYDGDYENALALFQDEADKGNVPAIYNIAKMYQRGQLGEEYIPKAQEYYAIILLLVLNRNVIELMDVGDNHHVCVQYGDVFSESILGKNATSHKRNILIAANRCFDTVVDDKLISSKSLHGMIMQKLYKTGVYTEDELNKEIQRQLKNERYIVVERKDKPHGNLKRYDEGSVVEVNDSGDITYFFLGLTSFDRLLHPYITDVEYVNALISYKWSGKL